MGGGKCHAWNEGGEGFHASNRMELKEVNNEDFFVFKKEKKINHKYDLQRQKKKSFELISFLSPVWIKN